MKTEKQICCFCFNIASEGNLVDSDILDLLKFLLVNVNTSALENSTVCDGCLNKIIETCNYKTRNSSKMLMGTKKETYAEKPMCQKCEKVCEEEDIFCLVDCITQIDWSDFVNYLFVDQDSQSLKSLQVCDFCRISLSNIQDFLKLIYVYDQSKMKYDIDNCEDVKVTGNKNLVEDKVEIKKEMVDDKTEIENIAEDDKTKIGTNDSYTDFKCKNEEVDLKLENDCDDSRATDRFEKGNGKQVISSGSCNKNSSNNEEEELGVNSKKYSNRLRYDLKLHSNIPDLQCLHCSKRFVNKLSLDNHMLRIHKCSDGVTSKIQACDKCGFITTITSSMLRHTIKHGVKTKGLVKYKCQSCIYETYDKNNLTRHMKRHNNIRDFKCTLCSKNFAERNSLDDHLLKVHKSKDNVTSKIHACDKCNYSTTRSGDLLEHQLKHNTKIEGLDKLQCQYCIYETYKKSHLIRHIKIHKNIRDYKCTLCSRNFTYRSVLNEHLLNVHKRKDKVTGKIHECEQCSYETTNKFTLSRHKLKHGIKVEGLVKHKCQYCIYETYYKSCLNKHIKIHKNIGDLQCIVMPRSNSN